MMNGRLKKWAYLVLVILVACLTFYLVSPTPTEQDNAVFCDAENITTLNGDTVFVNEGHVFHFAKPTKKESFKGEQSSLAMPGYSMSMRHELKVRPGNFITASIWKKGGGNKAYLSIVDNTSDINAKNYMIDSTHENGWEKLSVSLLVPPNYDKNCVFVEGLNRADSMAYFDNLSISVQDTITFPQLEGSCNIELSKKDLSNLYRELKNMYVANIKATPKHHQYSCRFTKDSTAYDGKVSLYSHHYADFYHGKWSLKIEFEEDGQHKTLQIISPEKNNFMHEWWLHQLLHQEGVTDDELTFMPLQLNGIPIGVYQVKTILHKKNEISLSWSEQSKWNVMKYNEYQEYFFENNHLTFEKNNSLDQQKAALNSAYSFLRYQEPLAKMADTSALGKYFAAIDAFSSLQGFMVPNYKLVYHTDTKIVAFEAKNLFQKAAQRPLSLPTKRAIFGNLEPRTYHERNVDYMLFGCLNDPGFVGKYIHYLQKYTSKSFIDTFRKRHQEKAQKMMELLQTEYRIPHDFWTFAEKKSNAIREELVAYIKNFQNRTLPTFLPYTPTYSAPCKEIVFIPESSVKIFKDINKKSTFYVSNFHCKSILLLGWGDEQGIIQERKEPLVVTPYWEEGQLKSLVVEPDFDYAYFQIEGEEKVYKEKVYLFVN